MKQWWISEHFDGVAVTVYAANYDSIFIDGKRGIPVVEKAEYEKLKTALERIVARSHSWVITHETGPIEKPIHDSYREIAKAALKDIP